MYGVPHPVTVPMPVVIGFMVRFVIGGMTGVLMPCLPPTPASSTPVPDSHFHCHHRWPVSLDGGYNYGSPRHSASSSTTLVNIVSGAA